MEKKYQIQKNSVQETLIIPLCGRKLAMDMYPDLFHDQQCQRLFEHIDYHYESQGHIKEKVGALMSATRQYDMVCVCREYLKSHPKACVVNLGCGLDTTFRQVDNGQAKGYNIDFPDVIDIRNELLPACKRESNLAFDIMDFGWFKAIDYCQEDGIVFFASGVFYYFKEEDVKRLFCAMASYFSGGKLAFDATNARGLKNMAKTWLKPSQMKNIGVYLSIEDEKELYRWSPQFQKVVRKGYMTGYRPLDSRFGMIINLAFWLIDHMKLCQMIEITFQS